MILERLKPVCDLKNNWIQNDFPKQKMQLFLVLYLKNGMDLPKYQMVKRIVEISQIIEKLWKFVEPE